MVGLTAGVAGNTTRGVITVTVDTTTTALGSPAVDASPIRRTLDATVERFVETLRHAPSGSLPVAGMRWRVGEIGAHAAQTATSITTAARGEIGPYGERGEFNAAVDQQLVDQLPERDPQRLAALVDERYAGMRAAFAERRDDDIVPQFMDYSIAAINAVWVADLNTHGVQIGQASGRPFRVDNEGLRLAFATVMPFAADPDGSRGMHATYALHIKGTQPVTYTVDDGVLHIVSGAPRIDCHIGVDPVAFLRVTLGVMPQWRAVATLKMRSWGRKPWLAGRIPKIFPMVPHGGVGRA